MVSQNINKIEVNDILRPNKQKITAYLFIDYSRKFNKPFSGYT